MAVALYARVSTPRQAENDLSIPDQLRQLREYGKARNLAIASEYIEPGASATDDRRPVFQQMIADATQPPAPFDAILVHSRSRFFRDLFAFLQYERILKKAGVRIVSITQETSDDAAGEMASKLFSLFDEYQSKENAKHTQRAMQENARQGYWNGSVPPSGFRAAATDTVGNRGRRKRRLETDPLEAETVGAIYRLYLTGHDGKVLGMKAIATHLNRQGRTMRGRPWRMQKVNRLLSDPLYTGCFYFNRHDSKTRKERPQPEWIAVPVPAIIDAGTFERTARRAKLKDRQALALRRVNADTVNAFCSALKERFSDPTSGLVKAYLRLLVGEIRLDGNALVVTGSHRRLADAIGFMQKRKLGEVPSFVNDWRARQESNL
jgi:site-specific DNA recombinase